MNTPWDWPGSRWWRVDLHAHTPASYDFGTPADRAEPDWRRWTEAARDAGLQAVAITDHNTAKAVDHLQQVAKKVENPPVLFAGVEITACDRTHLLFLFDPGCGEEHVDALLTQTAVPIEHRGKQKARSTLSIEKLLDLGKESSAVVVSAHANDENGLLLLRGEQRIAVLKHPELLAVEMVPDKQLDGSWLDGSHPEIGRSLPQISSSDSHDFDQAGCRFTWIKMTRPDIVGLRLALQDGDTSLRPAMKGDSFDPNRVPDLAIESITVDKAKYIGRSKSLTVAFNPWFNAIIGGRGTGKSTLIDFCRKTLRRGEELPTGGDDSLRAKFDRRLRVPPDRNAEGLLTSETVLELTYRKSGERFRLTWEKQKQKPSIQRQDGDNWLAEEGDIRQRFPVRIYSQKQLFDLATRPSALLTVIDDTDEVGGTEWRRKSKQEHDSYLSLRAEARALRTGAEELPALRATLADVDRKNHCAGAGWQR